MGSVQQALGAAEYKRAEELLAQAKRVFPGDRELVELERRVRDGMAGRAQAERILEAAAKAAGKEKWRKALEAYQEAGAIARTDAVIRAQVVNGLLGTAEAALQSDAEAAEQLVAEAARLEPGSPMLAAMRARMDALKRAQLAEQCLAAAHRCATAGDWQAALRAVDRGLASYPQEERLLERRAWIEGEMRRRAEQLVAREAHEREAREQEARQKAQREEEQRLVRERQTERKAAGEKAAREKALEEEQRRAEAATKTVVPSTAEAADLSATQIFLRGTAETTPEAATAAASSEWPTSAPPLPPAAPKVDVPLPASRADDPASSQRTVAKPVPNGPSDATIQTRAGLPTAAVKGDATPIQPGVHSGSDELTEGSLQIIERHLAAFIGPMAKILVKREASQTKSLAELYAMLAARLDREEDRKAFLAKRTGPSEGKAASAFTKLAPAPASPPAPAPVDATPAEITQAVIDLAARKLAAYLGPIGPLVAKKEAKRAGDLREFYELLAGHVDAKDRERFLKEAGVVKEAPAAGFLRRPDGTAFFPQPGDKTTAQTKPVVAPERKA